MKFINTPSKIRTSSSRKKSTAMRIQKRVRGNQTHRRQQKQKKIRTIRNKFNKYKNVRSYKKKFVGGGPQLVTAADRAKQSAKAEERRLIAEELARKRAMAEAALKIKEEEAAATLAALDEARDALTRAEIEAEAEVWREMEAEKARLPLAAAEVDTEANSNRDDKKTVVSEEEELTEDEEETEDEMETEEAVEHEYDVIISRIMPNTIPPIDDDDLNNDAKLVWKKFNDTNLDKEYSNNKVTQFKNFLYLCCFLKVFDDNKNNEEVLKDLLKNFRELYKTNQTSKYFKEFFVKYYGENNLTIEKFTLDKDGFAESLQSISHAQGDFISLFDQMYSRFKRIKNAILRDTSSTSSYLYY